VQDTGYFTILSMDGEYTSNTLSERRGSVLRTSAAALMVGYPTGRQGQIKARFAGEMPANLFEALSSSSTGRGLLKQAPGRCVLRRSPCALYGGIILRCTQLASPRSE
jgi:hypothetical protein